MISSNKDLADFQEQVSNIISDISDPQVNDKMELLMESMNAGEDSDLPFKVEEGTEDKPGKECRQKLNELYLTWKKDGCNPVMLNSIIRKEIHLCTCKYLGSSDKEISAPTEQHDALLSQDDIKKQQRREKNKCCTIF